MAALTLGAGRETKEAMIDLSVGILLHKKVGDEVEESAPVAMIYYNDKTRAEEAKRKIQDAYEITEKKPQLPPLVHGLVSKSDN